MNVSIRWLVAATIASVLLTGNHCAAAADDALPKARLAVRVYDNYAVAGLPVILRLSVTNTGRVPFHYWCGGPDRYPPAGEFVATVEGTDGEAREVPLSNGQYTQGSGSLVWVEPGQTVWLPATIDSLPPGRYTIRTVRCEEQGYFPVPNGPMKVTWPTVASAVGLTVKVRKDPTRYDQIVAELLARTRANDPFAQHVATEFRVAQVIKAMMADLGSDDQAAGTAARVLFMLRDPKPDGLGDTLKRAVVRRLRADESDRDVLSLLSSLAEQEGSDASLDSVLAIVLEPGAVERSRYVLQDLFNFKQARATEALRKFVAHPDSGVRFTAAVGLSKRRDPAAVPVLVAASREPGHPDRTHAFYRLEDYPDDPRAVAAIEAGARDPDEAVRRSAISVRESLNRGRQRADSAGATRPATKVDGTGQ
jgi:hypothetical protein